MKLADIMSIYLGSNAAATTKLYKALDALGPVGKLATHLFRATKTSERAKTYRPSSRHKAYDTKQWSMNAIAKLLTEHGEDLNINWGWGEDPAQEFHKVVLYVDLPVGQVSFHTNRRGIGPDYAGVWDGVRNIAGQRVCRFAARVFSEASDTKKDISQ